MMNNLFVIGNNRNGELCLNHNEHPVRELTNANKYNQNLDVLHINHGSGYTIITTPQYNYLAVGANDEGQLGLGHTTDCINITASSYWTDKDIKISKLFTSPWSHHTVWISQKNDLYAHGRNLAKQCNLSMNRNMMVTDSEVMEELKNIARRHKTMRTAVEELTSRLPAKMSTNSRAKRMMRYINETEKDIELIDDYKEDKRYSKANKSRLNSDERDDTINDNLGM